VRRERILRTCIRVLCVLCAKERQIYTFCCGDDPQQKKILKKSSPFLGKSLKKRAVLFFFTFFLFFSSSKKELLTLLKRKSTLPYTVEREECRRHKHYLLRVVYIYISIPIRITHKTNTRRCSYTSRKESFRSCSCSPSTKTRTRR